MVLSDVACNAYLDGSDVFAWPDHLFPATALLSFHLVIHPNLHLRKIWALKP